MRAENAFTEAEFVSQETSPDIFELNIISGGCHLYGYLLTPDKRYEKPYPTVIMSHGFPGYTTNNDLELALMRMGCVVIHMNHRGAWGSEGNYLFTNLKDDLIAIAKWAHNPAIAQQYDIDTENIFLVGHSMGGMTVLNAAKELDFIKGVAAMAAYDIGGAFRFKLEKELFLMIETEGQCLNMNSASEVYENGLYNCQELSVCHNYEKLLKHNVLLVEARYDTVAPPDKMLKPLADRLRSESAKFGYAVINGNHSFIGQRMELSRVVGEWLEEKSKA
ncbi:MAG: alpha/beta hydrolase family protein [Oscillospiraceae bacterium]